jgi:hemerythrin
MSFDFNSYKIGIPLIDADHQSLFDEVFRLKDIIDSGKPVKEMGDSINFLYHYVGAHFAREEQLMKEKHYPKFAEHKAIHHHLKKVVYAVRKIFQEDPGRIDKEKLKQFLEAWLKEHILKIDTLLEPYINGPYGYQGQNTSTHQPLVESTVPDSEVVEVTVRVPRNRINIIERCAFILLQETPESHDLEELAISAAGMSMEEAEELAAGVLSS